MARRAKKDQLGKPIERYSMSELLSHTDFAAGSFVIGFKRNERENTSTEILTKKQQEMRAAWQESVIDGVLMGNRKSRIMRDILRALIPAHLLRGLFEHTQRAFRYKHCEPAFFLSAKGKERFGEDKLLGVAAIKGSPVHLYARNFNESYDWVHVAADINQLKAILMHCYQLQGAPFSANSMVGCMTMPGPDIRKRWFCSYLTAALLEYLEPTEGHFNRPNTLTVDDLHMLVSSENYRPVGAVYTPAVDLRDSIRRYAEKHNVSI